MKVFWLGLTILYALPSAVFGADSGFVPLVGIPYVDTRQNVSLGDYVNGLYWAAISIGAVLAVLMIIYAGVEYALADVVTTKAAAKKRIQGALVGLLIVVSAVLILNTINPSIQNITLLNLKPLSVNTGTNPNGNNTTLTNAIINLCFNDSSNTNECVVESCGLSINCSAWCSAKHGILADNPGLLNAQCFYKPQTGTNDDFNPRVNETLIGSVNCTDNGNGTFSCGQAIAECQGSGGTRWPATADNRMINCYKANSATVNDIYTEIQTRNITCGDYKCVPEQQKCIDEGGSVKALRTEGWFSVSYYIVCETPVKNN